MPDADFGIKSKIFIALSGFIFLIWSTTSFAFCGDTLTFLAMATASIFPPDLTPILD
jgi:hypothetical protein